MKVFTIDTPGEMALLKRRLTAFAAGHSYACVLDSCHLDPAFNYKNYEFLTGWGCKKTMKAGDERDFFTRLEDFKRGNWVFGYLAYDLKNKVEVLNSTNEDVLGFPDACLFVPEVVAWINKNELYMEAGGREESLFEQIKAQPLLPEPVITLEQAPRAHTSREAYLRALASVKDHLAKGDIYELNYCIEFSTKAALNSPFSWYEQLIERSPAPFSGCLQMEDLVIISASPERFLAKKGERLISQPIKGTAPRGENAEEDERLKKELLQSPKERAENVMIVDLVRNDLSRVCKAGSVTVDELFGIYSFVRVHQMISTVSGEMLPEYTGCDAIRYAFPMGSMTGAPKIRAMEIIEELEDTKRGPFSGAMGYFTPDGDFDFNVLIRSMYYNRSSQQLKFNAGGAITFDSDAEKEYAECLLKLKTIQELLGIDQ